MRPKTAPDPIPCQPCAAPVNVLSGGWWCDCGPSGTSPSCAHVAPRKLVGHAARALRSRGLPFSGRGRRRPDGDRRRTAGACTAVGGARAGAPCGRPGRPHRRCARLAPPRSMAPCGAWPISLRRLADLQPGSGHAVVKWRRSAPDGDDRSHRQRLRCAQDTPQRVRQPPAARTCTLQKAAGCDTPRQISPYVHLWESFGIDAGLLDHPSEGDRGGSPVSGMRAHV